MSLPLSSTPDTTTHFQLSADKPEWASLSFDTSVLGVRTALLAPSLAPSRVEAALRGCAAEGIELVYWTPDTESSVASHFGNLPGYAVTHMVEFERVLGGDCLAASCPTGFRFHDEGDEAGYTQAERNALACLAFLAGEHSRFRRDPALTNAQFKRMYSTWLHNSINGKAADKIIAVRSEDLGRMMTGENHAPQSKVENGDIGSGDIAGFITIKLSSDKSTASIGLLAVSPSYHRQGLGSVLTAAAESWAQSKGARTMSVKTQAINRSAMSFYPSRAFLPSGSPKATYHIWLTHKVLPCVRYNVPYITGDEINALSRVVTANAIDSLGPHTVACERWLEARLECSKALLTLSATAALEQAVLLCELEPGDEVIMPSFTFVSTANAVALRGAVPVFVDVAGGDDLNLDPEAVRRSVTDKTKAIIVVHYGGKACNMDAIMLVAEEHQLTVIEDAAQAFLSTYNGKYLGTIGHIGCLSFHYTKNTICGEGGALLVNDPKFHFQAVIVREKGTNRTEFMLGKICKYEWLCLGSSYVPSELCAAFLLPQLHDAEEVTRRRRLICTAYTNLLAPLAAQCLLTIPKPTEASADGVNGAGGGPTHGNGHLFAVLFPSPEARQAAQAAMAERNIQCLTHFVPLHLSEGGKRYGRISGSLERTVAAAMCLLRLPVWPGMHFGHVHRVVDALFQHFSQEAPSIRSVIDIFLPKH